MVGAFVTIGLSWFSDGSEKTEPEPELPDKPIIDLTPPVPVKATYRDSAAGHGYVVQIRNLSGDAIRVRIDIRDPQTDRTGLYYADLDPYQVKEIGWLEGWTFRPGQTVKLSNNDYKSRTMTLP